MATLQCRSQGDEVINTAYSERLNVTFREHLAPLARRCQALARHTLTLHEGMFGVGTVNCGATPAVAGAGKSEMPLLSSRRCL